MGICVSCRRRERKAPEKRSALGAGQPAKGAAAAELLPRRFDRLPMMANSMSNIKMTNPIKGIVSRRRRRYVKDGFDLDLAYITDRLIAMGFPAEKLEGVYRNHIDEVYRFLETMHKDHYKIYNLCSERSYDKNKFHDRVERYAFEDHTPPNIEIIQPFCEDVHNWLSADSKNVAAVHCKAGKGRTGTMVCCYLLYSRQKATADEALKFYGIKRAHDNKGVTIPSQRRYVEYYAWLLQSGVPYVPCKLHIRELLMSPPPTHAAAHHATPELLITQARPFFKAPIGCVEVRRTALCVRVQLDQCTPLVGDVRLDVFHKHKMKRKEKLFHFWFNTFFLTAGAGAQQVQPLPDSPNLETYKLTLNKWQLDDAHKDKQHKYYSQDFKVELIVQKMPDSSTFAGCARSASPPPSSASSCSSASASERSDTHWDSGEPPIPYSRLAEEHTLDTNLHGDTNATNLHGHTNATNLHGDTNATNLHSHTNAASLHGDSNASNDAATDSCGTRNDAATGRMSSDATLDLLDAVDKSDLLIGADRKGVNDAGLTLDVGEMDRMVDGYFNGAAKSNQKNARHQDGNAAVSDGSIKGKVGIYCPYHAVTSYHLPGGIEVQAPIENFTKNIPFFKGSRTKNTNSTKCTCVTESRLNPIYISDNPTLNPIYNRPFKSSSEVPASNPIYCSKAPETRESPEPMDYANDVISSAPGSARESPVEDKKKTEDKTKPRLSLGDMRASWREFSGKFASDSRRKKDDS